MAAYTLWCCRSVGMQMSVVDVAEGRQHRALVLEIRLLDDITAAARGGEAPPPVEQREAERAAAGDLHAVIMAPIVGQDRFRHARPEAVGRSKRDPARLLAQRGQSEASGGTS